MLVILGFGFAAGVPYNVTRDLLKAWVTESGADLASIGLFSMVTLPLTLKFIWAPLMDRYVPPFLGRRRGWILLAQIGLALSLIFLGQTNPKENLLWVAIAALVVSFFHASHDIVIDAHRREFLTTEELGFGSGLYMNMYRAGMIAALAVGILVAQNYSYEMAYWAVAGLILVGVITDFCAEEPKITGSPPASLKEAVIEPFKEFFRRPGALLILLFFLLYKLGDNMGSAMTVPFVLKMGFEKTDYLYIVKGVGMIALFAGMLAGGAVMLRLGLFWSLIAFGILQMLSTAAFALLAFTGKSYPVLTGVVVFELLSTGLGTTAYATFMALQTNKRFTATQYALFTSLMAIPGTVAASITGYIAEATGWMGFYVICALVAIPGLFLIPKVWTPENTPTK